MQADCLSDSRYADQQQTQTLCDDLDERSRNMEREQVMLAELVDATEKRRPYQASRYRAMLENVHGRFIQLRAAIDRYCR